MAIEGKLRPAVHGAAPAFAWGLGGLAVLSIWAGVVLASIVAPDFVSGSQHEHLQLVQWLDWIWGAVATSFVILAVTAGIRRGATAVLPWAALAIGTAVIWAGVALVTLFAPVYVTGSDPTEIPLAALGVPIVGVFLTWFVATLAKSAFAESEG